MVSRRILNKEVELRRERRVKADRERRSLLAGTVFFGTLGLMFVLPVIAGAYIGLWLDRRLHGYSVAWTLQCILLGVVVGALNVYFLVRRRT